MAKFSSKIHLFPRKKEESKVESWIFFCRMMRAESCITITPLPSASLSVPIVSLVGSHFLLEAEGSWRLDVNEEAK